MSAIDETNWDEMKAGFVFGAKMLLTFREVMREEFAKAEGQFNHGMIDDLTVAYLDKIMADAQPPLSPDLAQAYERMSGFFAAVAARERDE